MSKTSVARPCPAGNCQPVNSPACIDLAERFGRRYRIDNEPAYAAQYGPRSHVSDPWLKIIPCRAGHIYPWGGTRLAAVTHRAGPLARKLAAVPGVTVWLDGSDGVTALFDVAVFPAVAKVMHPRYRRRLDLTPAQRAKIGRRLSASRKMPSKTIVGITPRPRPDVQRGLVDLEAVPAGSAVSDPCF